jgi:hypothetical protein
MAGLEAESKANAKKFEDARNLIMEIDVNGRKMKDVLAERDEKMKKYEPLVKAVMKPYDTLAPTAQEAFDQKIGINRYANPSVGEAYTLSSGGPNKKEKGGADVKTWNFHWAGVIFKSTTASDNVTLENYAGSAAKDWVFQIYGVPTVEDQRKTQTFHEQHRDTHRQHGEKPTTMATQKS